ncbi:MAG: matrixin family metalloprotease [Cyanobacteria bacterium REEB67]|nr:matrixin family metalloprotease [Cyanobacteria bacterium REEB67]
MLAALAGLNAPALARHDYFLLGEAPGVKAWDSYLPGEDGIASAPLERLQHKAILALYLVPALLDERALKSSDRELLELIPPYKEAAAIGAEKKRTFAALSVDADKRLSPALADSMRFLRWRVLALKPGRHRKINEEVQAFLTKYNQAAKLDSVTAAADINALSEEFGRRQSRLDRANLQSLDRALIRKSAAEQAQKKEESALKEYENHVAEAYVMASLDRRGSASEHFSEAINYLRPRAALQRPQTDELRKAWLHVIDEELFKYEEADSSKAGEALAADQTLNLKRNIGWLIDIAYLAKIDGRLNEAAFEFRRAFLLVARYFPEEQNEYSYLTYDLGETLLWDEKFDESVYYFDKCLQARAKADPLSLTTVDTANMLGRAGLRQGQAKLGLDVFYDNLSRIARRLQLEVHEAGDDERHQELVNALLADLPRASSEDRRQIDDALQGTVDAAIPLKQYDLALSSGESLLAIRSSAEKVDTDMIMSVLWGMAYACDSSARPERAIKYYDRLIDSYGKSMKKLLPSWYHGRGLDYDLVGRPDLAAKDIKMAIALYKEKLLFEEDEESRDHLTWTIADLHYNLEQAKKYPPDRPDYADLADNKRWRRASFPLKVFVGRGPDDGFGGDILKLVHEAVDLWRDYPQSPIAVQYVDDLSKADIFIERVTTYDDIPYGSAGRTSANFEHLGERETRVITRAHVRVYCPSYDGTTWENQNVKMSDFARTQLKYLLVHELGHVFGLAHSPAGPDIMFWKSCSETLSSRDVKTIERIYVTQPE